MKDQKVMIETNNITKTQRKRETIGPKALEGTKIEAKTETEDIETVYQIMTHLGQGNFAEQNGHTQKPQLSLLSTD